MGMHAQVTQDKKSTRIIVDALKWMAGITEHPKRSVTIDDNLLLEPRIMFDAAFAADIIDSLDPDDATTIDAFDTTEAPAFQAPTDIIVIDDRIEGHEQFAQNMSSYAQVIVINGAHDGLEQIIDGLGDRTDITALHIVSHGNDGEIYIGKTTTNASYLTGDQAAQWSDIGAHLTQDADILFYGCSFGLGDTGREVTQKLADLTGADIASASQDVSAEATTLDQTIGDIETSAIDLDGIDSRLALSTDGVISFNASQASISNNGDTLTTNKVEFVNRVNSMVDRIWTYSETANEGPLTFRINTNEFATGTGIIGTAPTDIAILLIDSDGNVTNRITASWINSNGFAIFNGVDLSDGQQFRIATKSAPELIFTTQPGEFDEDSEIDLAQYLNPDLYNKGEIANTFATSTAYAAQGAQHVTFEIPAGATSIKITGKGSLGYSSGKPDGKYEDELITLQINVDLSKLKSSGYVSYLTDTGISGGTHRNGSDIFAWSGKTLDANTNVRSVAGGEFVTYGGKSYGDATAVYDNTIATLPTIWIDDTGKIHMSMSNSLKTAFMAEFQNNSETSADLIRTEGLIFAQGSTQSQSIKVPENTAYVKITQIDLINGSDYNEESKISSYHYIDLQTGAASGVIAGDISGKATSNGRDVAYAYELNADAGRQYAVGNGTAASFDLGQATTKGDDTNDYKIDNKLKLNFDANGNLTVIRDMHSKNSGFTIEFYERLDVGAESVIIASSADTIAWPSTDPNHKDLTFSIPDDAKYGILNINAIAQSHTKSYQINENTINSYVMINLVDGTTSGSFYNYRSGRPDIMVWDNVPFGENLANYTSTGDSDGSTVINQLDPYVSNTRVYVDAETNSVIFETWKKPANGSINLAYYALGQVEWLGNVPTKINIDANGGSLDAGTYNANTGLYSVSLSQIKANDGKLILTPADHKAGLSVIDVYKDGVKTESVDVYHKPVIDAIIDYSVNDVVGYEDTWIDLPDLSIKLANLVDKDGSEAITKYELSGLPIGWTIKSGDKTFTASEINQSINLADWDLANIQIIAGENVSTTGENGTDGITLRLDYEHTDTDQKSETDIRTDIATGFITFNVAVRAVNDDPVAQDFEANLNDGAAAGTIVDVKTLFTDAENDALTYSLSGTVPDWVVFDPATGLLTINEGGIPSSASQGGDPDNPGIYKFWVDVSDGNGGTAQSEITLNVANVDPTGLGGGAALEDGQAPGTLLDLDDRFTDPDGDTLTYSFTTTYDPPTWVEIDPETGELKIAEGGIPADASTGSNCGTRSLYKIEITADDGEGGTVTKLYVLYVANIKPVPTDIIASASVNDGQTSGSVIDMSEHFTDADGDTGHKYSITSGPDWLTIDETTGIISIKDGASVPSDASQNGSYTVTVKIDDTENGKAYKDVTITANNPAPTTINHAKTFRDGDPAANIIDLNKIFTDPDGDTLTFTLGDDAPDWLAIDQATGQLYIKEGGIPSDASMHGNGRLPIVYTFTINANDGQNGTVDGTFNYFVINVTPTATTAVATANVTDAQTSGELIDMSQHFTDADGDTGHKYSILNGPDWLEIDPDTGVISIAAGAQVPSDASTKDPYTVTVEIDDQQNNGKTTKTVQITAENVNPSATAQDKSLKDGASEGALVDLKTVFNDPDKDTLIYTLGGTAPEWLEIDNETGELRVKAGGIPSDASQGGDTQTSRTYVFEVHANDGQGGTATAEFTYTVSNVAPTATSNAAVTAVQDGQTSGTLIEMANHFDDTDGDSGHTYSLENAPLWVEIDPDTGVISIKPGAQVPSDASMQGPYVMTVSINDHEGGTATKTVTLNAINTEITATGTLPNLTVTKEQSLSIPTNIFTDVDGDRLEFSASGLPSGLTLDPDTGLITGKLAPDLPIGKTYLITITVTDNEGSTVTKSFSLSTEMPMTGGGVITTTIFPSIQPQTGYIMPTLDVENVVIETARALDTANSTIKIDASQPINTAVNDLVSLAEMANIKSSLPIKTLVQDELANLDERRFIDVARKDPAASGRILTFNPIDQGDLIATLTETAQGREIELASTAQGDVRIVDQFPLEGLEITPNGKVIVADNVQDNVVSLTVEVDIQGTLTVRDILVNTQNGELEEISREQRGSQFTEMLNWQAVMF